MTYISPVQHSNQMRFRLLDSDASDGEYPLALYYDSSAADRRLC